MLRYGRLAVRSMTRSIKSNRSSVVAKPEPAVMPRTASIGLEYVPSMPSARGSRYAANESLRVHKQ
eukprot:10276987-Karenia_brevis.AAC.1